MQRKDVAWRRYASRFINELRERTTRVRITDHGCMFRGYARSVVEAVNQCSEYNTFVPALAYTFAARPVEIPIAHEDRGAGQSKYSLFQLMRLNFDLMTGFSTAPMQMFSVVGIGIAVLSVLFVVFLAIRRLVVGPEAEGLFTLFAIAFFLIGVALFGVGLLGEYVSRIYDEVRHRPRYIVGSVLERNEDET
jgi:undecaprenyl-phosphate 4-deoxy-4-formamido-L-arabinose transferase